MPRSEFNNGLPWAEARGLGYSADELQKSYGIFSASVLYRVIRIDPNAPRDIITFGDDWVQLVNLFNSPRTRLEEIASQGVPGAFFGNNWPVMDREPQDLFAQWQLLMEGVQAGTLDRRMIAKLTVLDLTERIPIFEKQDLMHVKETPWGLNGILAGTPTEIYAIRRAFAERNIEPVKKIKSGISVVMDKKNPRFEVKEE